MQTSLAAILQLRGQASPSRGLLDKFETLADTADDKKTSKRAKKTLDYLLNVQLLLGVFMLHTCRRGLVNAKTNLICMYL